jgi:hypothetical protein
MMKLGKYEFNNKKQAEDKVNTLGVNTHSIVLLGYLILTEGIYNELGNVIIEPIKSEGYSIDVLWNGLDKHPYGWKSYSIKVNNPKHSFLGVDNDTQL